ncbi:unnamed protein product [Schistosoma curassoni]|uniref:DUF3553 domain-containing protein n=1 Tax=Schistosoma curassoni TaxID=6186 RepID=A0A183JN31_9TREM|nr:unnamed protein product [Schistosoma curassoni]
MVQETNDPIFSSAIAIRRNVNWFKDGPPEKGSLIKVLWDDGMEYAGTYEGTTSEQWEVQLESGEIRVFNREQFYVQPKTKYSDSKSKQCIRFFSFIHSFLSYC